MELKRPQVDHKCPLCPMNCSLMVKEANTCIRQSVYESKHIRSQHKVAKMVPVEANDPNNRDFVGNFSLWHCQCGKQIGLLG